MTASINPRRTAREAAGYSGLVGMQRLAKAVKMSAHTLYGYERGNFVPLGTARKLCRVLGCSLTVYQFKLQPQTKGVESFGSLIGTDG